MVDRLIAAKITFNNKEPGVIVLHDPIGNVITLTEEIKFIGTFHDRLSSAVINDAESESDPLAKCIAVLTSGGDSSGMNAAVRSIIRVAIANDCIPFAVYDGFQGLIEGGNKIRQFKWHDVKGYLFKGGTAIGTKDCPEFRTVEGRSKAVLNLIKNRIEALIVIGGDGSITGADLLRNGIHLLFINTKSINGIANN